MYLYQLRCQVTGKSYIGATTLSMSRRLDIHWRAALLKQRTTALAKAIREHGWDAFEMQILGETNDHAELMRMERATILALNTKVPNGYNMSSGGLGVPDCKASDETKAKLSAARKGHSSWNKGLKIGPMPEATKEKQRLRHLGQKAWNKSIPATPETRAKLSAMRKGALNVNARAIEFNGVSYPCITAACAATGMSKMQMRYRLQLGRAKYL